MITIYNVKKSEIKEGNFLVELRGLSTDEKPTTLPTGGTIENGSVFIEIDTGNVYLYNEEGTEWCPVIEEQSDEQEPVDNNEE